MSQYILAYMCTLKLFSVTLGLMRFPSWHFMMVVAGKPGIVIDYGEAKSTDGRLFRR